MKGPYLGVGLLAFYCAASAQYTIHTVAGGGPPDGTLATDVGMVPYGIAVDPSGNVYIASSLSNRIFKISPGGRLTTLAGNGGRGYSGDGGPAAQAQLQNPRGLAMDSSGNLYIADSSNDRIRKISSTGVITTVAGGGSSLGDGGPATGASLLSPSYVAVDQAGNLYISDLNHYRVRKVTANGIITTVAGNGTNGLSGGDGPAISVPILPSGLAVDRTGNLYIAEMWNHRVRKVSPDGRISTIAGNGSAVFGGDGGPAVNASLFQPQAVALDAAGNLYIADTENQRIRKVSPDGLIDTVIADGEPRWAFDPVALAIDSTGALYVANYPAGAGVVKLSAGHATHLAGNGTIGYSGDAGPALSAQLTAPYAVDTFEGTVYFTDSSSSRIRKVSNGVISTVSTMFQRPTGLAADGAGHLYVTDANANQIKKLSPGGTLSLVAGIGARGFAGDGGPALWARLNSPHSLTIDGAGNLYFVDWGNTRVRKISREGIISTVAGSSTRGMAGDGGPATLAQLYDPFGVAVDRAGNLYIADAGRVRKVAAATGIITTVAGTGTSGSFSGDSGPATQAQLFTRGVAIDAAGNLWITDSLNHRIRKVSTDGVITTVAGNGISGFAGDTGPALAASLSTPFGIAVDATGIVYFTDIGDSRVRVLLPPLAVQPDALSFSYRVGAASAPFQTLTVPASTAHSNIAATVLPGAPWISVSGPGSTVPVSFAVSINPHGLTPATYAGAIRLAALGQAVDVPVTLTVLPSCVTALNPPTRSASSSSGVGTFTVVTTEGCSWNANSDVPWLSLASRIGTGNSDPVGYFISANAGPARHGTITVNGVPFTVSQAAAPGVSPGLLFRPVTPCRVADTRNAFGPFGGPGISAGSSRSFALPASGCGIPYDAVAYSVNITAVPKQPLPYLTLWPAGLPMPFVSTLNSFDGRIKANAAIVPAGVNGGVGVFATGATDVVLDVDGYFVPASSGGLAYYPVEPCREDDTRAGPPILSGQSRTFLSRSFCGVPSSAHAYSLNLTAIPSGPLGYLTIWPAGQPQPFVSTLNALTGAVTANAAIVRAGAGGLVSIFASDPTHVVLDVNGYFAPPGNPGALSFYAVQPCRISDSRLSVGPFGGPIVEGGPIRTYAVPRSGCGIPATAKAYSLNVTAIPSFAPLWYLSIWPGGRPQPMISTLNSFDATLVSNAAIVPAGTDGIISLYVSNPVHVVLDINGYFQ